MAENKAAAFVHKMKTRDMRIDIKDDFRPEEIDFDPEEMVRLIVAEQLPLDFVYDTMVGFFLKTVSFVRVWTSQQARGRRGVSRTGAVCQYGSRQADEDQDHDDDGGPLSQQSDQADGREASRRDFQRSSNIF